MPLHPPSGRRDRGPGAVMSTQGHPAVREGQRECEPTVAGPRAYAPYTHRPTNTCGHTHGCALTASHMLTHVCEINTDHAHAHTPHTHKHGHTHVQANSTSTARSQHNVHTHIPRGTCTTHTHTHTHTHAHLIQNVCFACHTCPEHTRGQTDHTHPLRWQRLESGSPGWPAGACQ